MSRLPTHQCASWPLYDRISYMTSLRALLEKSINPPPAIKQAANDWGTVDAIPGNQETDRALRKAQRHLEMELFGKEGCENFPLSSPEVGKMLTIVWRSGEEALLVTAVAGTNIVRTMESARVSVKVVTSRTWSSDRFLVTLHVKKRVHKEYKQMDLRIFNPLPNNWGFTQLFEMDEIRMYAMPWADSVDAGLAPYVNRWYGMLDVALQDNSELMAMLEIPKFRTAFQAWNEWNSLKGKSEDPEIKVKKEEDTTDAPTYPLSATRHLDWGLSEPETKPAFLTQDHRDISSPRQRHDMGPHLQPSIEADDGHAVSTAQPVPALPVPPLVLPGSTPAGRGRKRRRAAEGPDDQRTTDLRGPAVAVHAAPTKV